MAKKQEVYWFYHDGNAHRQTNIATMMMVYGAEGYGWYWILLELMREAQDYKLSINGKYDLQYLAQEARAEPDKLKQFIADCINEFNLLASDGETIWSPSLLIKMASYNEVCEKRREAAVKSHINR